MKHTLNAALLALAAGLSAGLPTSGLPSGKADFAVHLSNETLDQTKVGKTLTSAFTAAVDANAVVGALKRELGFELDEDFRDLTAVGTAGDRDSACLLVRGKFNKARIEAFAAKNQVPSHAVKGLKAWDVAALAEAIRRAAGNDSRSMGSGKQELVIVDGNTVVVASAENIERAVAAAASGAAWKNDDLARAAGSVPNGWLLIAANVAAIEEAEAARLKTDAAGAGTNAPQPKRSGAKVVTLAVGESPTDVNLRVHADFVDEASAKRSLSQLKGLLGLGVMFTTPGEKDTADQAAWKTTGADILRRIKTSQSGPAADASLDYPVESSAKAILRAAQSGQGGK